MNEILRFVIVCLAAWRFTSLIVNEDGPYEILAKFRYFIGVRYDEKWEATGTNVVASALTCIWCTSVWTGAAFALVCGYTTSIVDFIGVSLAISAASIIIDKVASR